MQIEILLNRESTDYSAIQEDLAAEINSLSSSDVRISSRTTTPPPGTLGLHEAYQFLIDYGVPVLHGIAIKAVVEVVIAVVRRRTKEDKTKPPVVVIVVGDNRLPIPSSPARQKKFIKAVAESSPQANDQLDTAAQLPKKSPKRAKKGK